jgi:hypothetical protein
MLAAACGGDNGAGGDDTPGDGGVTIDADPTAPDAMRPDGMVPEGCTPGGPQCNDCIDNDADGKIDGEDIECSGAIDNDEGSFSTDIPGDNMDLVNQDCFFDGNSGGGDDGCNQHVCCLLGLTSAECSTLGYDNNYDPASDCPPPDPMCIEECGALVPPGCDCFGCCTICGDQGCVDIYLNPTVAPNCDETTIYDEAACPRCEQTTTCVNDCQVDATDCILCPGETEADLPPTCTGAECPAGQAVCESNADCPTDQFCSFGCCIFIVQ